MNKIGNLLYRLKNLAAFLIHASSNSALGKYPELKLIQLALNEAENESELNRIENLRRQLLKNKESIAVYDPGAGSLAVKGSERSIASIARSSLSSRGQCLFMHNLVSLMQTNTLIELGTSLGISTAYLSTGNLNTEIYSFEGSPEIANKAKSHFKSLLLDNIEVVIGNMDNTLTDLLNKKDGIDLVFMDGNHRKKPTIKYFESLSSKMNSNGLIIIDDIYWSDEMKEAWEIIKKHPKTRATVDFYLFGIVFLDSVQSFDLRIRPSISWLF